MLEKKNPFYGAFFSIKRVTIRLNNIVFMHWATQRRNRKEIWNSNTTHLYSKVLGDIHFNMYFPSQTHSLISNGLLYFSCCLEADKTVSESKKW